VRVVWAIVTACGRRSNGWGHELEARSDAETVNFKPTGNNDDGDSGEDDHLKPQANARIQSHRRRRRDVSVQTRRRRASRFRRFHEASILNVSSPDENSVNLALTPLTLRAKSRALRL
jgi:hypothetical protein